MSSSNNSQGESHRIYWQQWQHSTNNHANGGDQAAASTTRSKRDLITSSAAVRITSVAKAKDVTDLLRTTLQLPDSESNDCLILVGTLYSLPRDFVQFEHEIKQQQPGENGEEQASSPIKTTYSRSDPFHVVRTLLPSENPLDLRDKMTEHLRMLQELAPASRTIISPKVQWYFVPSIDDATKGKTLPNCIDLDGYSTCLEEDEDDFEEDETSTHVVDDDDEERFHDDDDENDACYSRLMHSKFPWLDGHDEHSQSTADPDDVRIEKRYRREERRLGQLLHSIAAGSQFMSGYLLKRSAKDPHVWRRVHCVLTDDYLWYISRIYDAGKRKYARHGRIRLTRALLLEPTPDYAPLYRIPFAFELVSANGTSHIFRTTNKAMQSRWMELLSERIVQSYENSLLQHAEMIAEDECLARSRRMSTLAAETLWDACAQHNALCQGHVGTVLRWGLEVADYRESCRYIQSMLPAKSPVVVTSSWKQSHPERNSITREPIDPALQSMIQASWDQATALLARASHIALQNGKLPRSIETHCQHIDYLITGRFRHLTNGEAENGSSDHHDPPPVSLFDSLLAEMQVHAATHEASRANNHATEDEPDTSKG